MEGLKHRGVGEYRWRGALIAVAICSLTISVATRFLVPCTPQSHIVRAVDRRSVEPMRQHLDRDGVQWVAPSSSFSVFEPIVIESDLAPDGPPLRNHVFSDSLYNRPPPSLQVFIS